MTGTGIDGTMSEFPTPVWNRTGEGGTRIGTGKDGRLGASTTMSLGRNERGRNSDSKGNGNGTRGPRFNGMSVRWKEGEKSIEGRTIR